MRNILVSPSILAADFKNLQSEITKAEQGGADYIHFDVMDGHFVKNISIGIPVLKNVSGMHNLVNDVHIMVSNPTDYIEQFAKAGANILTFHLEACPSYKTVEFMIYQIKKYGMKVGLSIKPDTDVREVLRYLPDLDLVLVMSVEPGFGGQSFMPCALDKIRKLRETIDREGFKTLIEVDGGINKETAELCKQAGVDILVAGTYLFGHEDIKERIEGLKK